jgi:hypothetical protein
MSPRGSVHVVKSILVPHLYILDCSIPTLLGTIVPSSSIRCESDAAVPAILIFRVHGQSRPSKTHDAFIGNAISHASVADVLSELSECKTEFGLVAANLMNNTPEKESNRAEFRNYAS